MLTLCSCCQHPIVFPGERAFEALSSWIGAEDTAPTFEGEPEHQGLTTRVNSSYLEAAGMRYEDGLWHLPDGRTVSGTASGGVVHCDIIEGTAYSR